MRHPAGPPTVHPTVQAPATRRRRWAMLAASVVALGAGITLGAAGIRPTGSCADHPGSCYRRIATNTAGVRRMLATTYEVGVGPNVYGSTTGRPVPWPKVVAWVTTHPSTGPGKTLTDQGFRTVSLPVRGGHAYLQFAPDGRITKIYLSATALRWD